jgi:lipopolysaccharide transport system ATP-binding protein
LCSHSMYHVQKLCRAALWLKDGRMARYGPAAEIAQAYLAYHEEKSVGAGRPIAAPLAREAGYYAIQSLTLDPPERLASGSSLAVAGEVYSPDDRAPVVLVGLVRADGTPIYGVATDMDGVAPERTGAQRFAFSLTFPQLPLLPGKYIVRAHALDPEGVRLFDNVERSFVVEGVSRELGFVHIGHGWNGGDPR